MSTMMSIASNNLVIPTRGSGTTIESHGSRGHTRGGGEKEAVSQRGKRKPARVDLMSDDDLIVRHAEHFLSRLDRLNTREVDLALGLYRDPDLLRGASAGVVAGAAERVAVSLGDSRRGPFIVVTRAGHFVTCLAEGM